MDYFLTEEQLEIKEIARKVAEEKIKPLRAKYDEGHEFPWEIVDVFKQTDLFAVLVPEEYGGISGKVVDVAIITEEFSRICGGIGLSLGGSGLGMYPILISGSEEQKQKYLPLIADGEKLAAFALTEANAGSDAGGLETTAVKDGDFYILNGTKQWITNGGEADIYTVFVLTDKLKGARGASWCILFHRGKRYGRFLFRQERR
jgi:alkylation response protein AidB-like acyl-CoA dehydrogenase